MRTAEPDRRERLLRARLYLVCPARPRGRDPRPLLRAALAGGVDVVQLRDKEASDDDLRAAAAAFREACGDRALFLVNDRPDLARDVGADGVHVGQADVPVAEARAAVGPDLLVGLSTHSPADVEHAQGADYLGVGPVHATPTKPGRPPVGLDLVRYAVEHAPVPFFAIGGIDRETIRDVVDAGAPRVAVVRAIVEAEDPEEAARTLRAAVEAPVGAA